MRFRFLHAADLHLDSPFRGLAHLPPQLLEEVRSSTFQAYRRLVELAVRERVDFVLVAGDVYDLADRSLKAQVAFQSGLQVLAQHGIHAYVIHGNHDPLDAGQAALAWPETAHFFGGSGVASFSHVKDGVEVARIYGRSYPTAKFQERIVQQYVREAEVPFAVGLLHTNLDGDAAHEAYAPSSRAELAVQGMDYWALGHIHKRTVVAENPWVVYPGNLQGRSVKETGAKGCYLVEVDGGQVQSLQFHALDHVRWEAVEVDLTGAQTEGDALSRIADALRAQAALGEGRPLLARVRLVGETPLHRELKAPERREDWTLALQEQLAEERPYVWVALLEARTTDEIDRDEWRESETFLGDFLRLVQEAREHPELREELREVLAGVYRNQRVKKHMSSAEEPEIEDLLDEVEDLVLTMFMERGETA